MSVSNQSDRSVLFYLLCGHTWLSMVGFLVFLALSHPCARFSYLYNYYFHCLCCILYPLNERYTII